MGILRETRTHETHGVKCASCHARSSLKLPKEGSLSVGHNTRDFNDRDEFTCGRCRRRTTR